MKVATAGISTRRVIPPGVWPSTRSTGARDTNFPTSGLNAKSASRLALPKSTTSRIGIARLRPRSSDKRTVSMPQNIPECPSGTSS